MTTDAPRRMMVDVNKAGHPQTLVASHPGNTSRLRHGIRSKDGAALEPRAQEIAAGILAQPHVRGELDEIGAVEIGRLEALIEAIDRELVERGLTNKRGDARSLLDIRIRASRRLGGVARPLRADAARKSGGAAKLARPNFEEVVAERLKAIRAEENGGR